MSQARRVHNPDCKNAVLNVFDIIPVADFMLGVYNASLNTRLSVLKSMGSVFNRMSTVRLLDSKQFNLSTEAGAEHFREYANECVLAGFEGVMIKDLDAPYVCNRNTFWLKWKPTITIDLEVVDFEEGTGKNAGRLGAVIFSGSDNGRDITVSVGSGWSDDDRDYIWANRSEFTGRIGEIIADAVSKNKNGTYSLRFPRMNRWRDVFTGEKE
jgi:DNA ligase-1